MTPQLIFMFSGQGSQYYQMGKRLFSESALFKKIIMDADEQIYDLTQLSLVKSIYAAENTFDKPFQRLLLTHPAIFVYEYAVLNLLQQAGIYPDAVLGTSMGDFAAAVAAGMMNYAEALYAVIKQAECIETYCAPGGMLAVLASPEIAMQSAFQDCSELAAINFAKHFVVAGSQDQLITLQNILQTQAIVSQLLPVGFGFHSSLIEPAKDAFLTQINSLVLKKSQLPMIVCNTEQLVTPNTINYFWQTIRSPINFQQAIVNLDKIQPALYLDLGPSGTLSTFVRYNLVNSRSKSQTIALMTPAEPSFADTLVKINRFTHSSN